MEIYQGAIKFMPNWYMLFKSRDTDKKKLEFLRTILEYAFEDKVPEVAYRDPSTFTSAEEYAIFDAFWAAKPLVDSYKREDQERIKKVLAGSLGGSAGRGESKVRHRNDTLQADLQASVQAPLQADLQAPSQAETELPFINKNIEIENRKDNIDIDNARSDSKAHILELFEKFWEAYPSTCPRKYGKQQCRKKWEVIFRGAADADTLFKSILDGLAKWKASKMWNDHGGQYIMGPHRWLNNQSWEDGPAGEQETEQDAAASEERKKLMEILARTEG